MTVLDGVLTAPLGSSGGGDKVFWGVVEVQCDPERKGAAQWTVLSDDGGETGRRL